MLSVMFEQHHLEELLAASVEEQILYLEAADGTLLCANIPESDLPRMPLGERRPHDDSFSPGRLDGEQYLLCSRMMEATNVYLVSVVSESALQHEVASVSMRLQIIYVLISLAGLAAVIPLARSITKRIFLLQAQMMRTQTGVISKLEIAEHYDDEIGRLVTHYNEMVDKMGDLLQEQYALGQMKTEAELKALQSQINPHFLYNTLEMINWMAQKDEIDNIQNVVQAMSRFYRLTLSRGHDIVTIGDEIRMCDAYMDIQKRRYRGKILYQVEIDEDMLKSCEINGGLYGIPQYSIGIQNTDEGFFFREDLRKEWGLGPVMDLASMEAYLYRAKEEDAYKHNPLITDNRIWTSLWLLVSEGKYLEIGSMQETPFVVALADDPGVLVKRTETPEFQTVVSYIRKWLEAGILESNMLSLSDNEGARGRQMMLADRKPCETNSPFWSIKGGLLLDLWEAHPDWEYSFFPYCKNHQTWYADAIANASVISVSSKTKYPETAIKLLANIHTDQRYYDLVRYGVEGIHYNLTDGLLDYTGIPSANVFGWTPITDNLLTRDTKYVSEKWYEEIELPYYNWQEEITEYVEINPLGEFSMDFSELETVRFEIEQIRERYFQPILCGYYADTGQALMEANAALEQAGFNEYFDSLQQQITEYFENREK